MMLRHFPTNPWEGLDVPSALLLGIQRDPGPPVLLGSRRFERLRIVIIDRDEPADEVDAEDETETTEGDDEPQILPQLMRWGAAVPPARRVHGEILRGENGALYERFGQRIRPLRSLAAGPRGEVVEIAAAPPPGAADRGPSASDRSQEAAEKPSQSPLPPAGPSSPDPVRALFPSPGQWRVVRFGDFRLCLTPQLAQPARIRESHSLPCHVQVFECAATQSREAIAAVVLGAAARAGELLVVTPPLVQALQLAAVLPPPVRGAQRFAHVSPAHDPTGREEQAAAAPGACAVVASSPAPTIAAAPVAAAPARKAEIPAAYFQNAPFIHSREAAHHELVTDGQAGANWLRRWFGRAAKTDDRALREWQLQLSGRSIDEQLWAVPPPAGWRRDEGICAWAAQALERGGYDSALLSEWRLYWRRRGC
jgi:hypothetical protein